MECSHVLFNWISIVSEENLAMLKLPNQEYSHALSHMLRLGFAVHSLLQAAMMVLISCRQSFLRPVYSPRSGGQPPVVAM